MKASSFASIALLTALGVSIGHAGIACSGSDSADVAPQDAGVDSYTPPPPPEDAGPQKLTPGKFELTSKVGDKQRTTVVVAPDGVKSGKVPLVIALHGAGEKAQNFIATTIPFENLAKEKGFVLAAPQGIPQSLTLGEATVNVAWDAFRSSDQGNIDVPFLDALLSSLVATGSIDESKISIYGYGDGAFMSVRFGLEQSERVACAATLAAGPYIDTKTAISAKRKLAFAMQIGTMDPGYKDMTTLKMGLEVGGFPVDFKEVAGAGRTPPPGDPAAPLGVCLGKSL